MTNRVFCMLAVVAALMAASCAPVLAAETALAQPAPTPDNPRKVLLQLTSDDPRIVNDLLFNVVNIQRFYGQDNVRIAVVTFSAGNRALYRDTSPVKARVESLLHYDVEFVACGNTMEATGRKPDDLIDGVAVATAGIPEIVERQLQGWHYIRP
ncbi:MAG: DsrE family protein [Proteobacteria bacterium]|nr:DsrE family protein [Pseudomonadota bacterium]